MALTVVFFVIIPIIADLLIITPIFSGIRGAIKQIAVAVFSGTELIFVTWRIEVAISYAVICHCPTGIDVILLCMG